MAGEESALRGVDLDEVELAVGAGELDGGLRREGGSEERLRRGDQRDEKNKRVSRVRRVRRVSFCVPNFDSFIER